MKKGSTPTPKLLSKGINEYFLKLYLQSGSGSRQKVNLGNYENYSPAVDMNRSASNQQYFSLMFPKPTRPGKKWRSTPSEIKEYSKGDPVKDDQKDAPMWMARSLLKISEKPSAYLAARRKPPFFTSPKTTTKSLSSSSGDTINTQITEKYRTEKTSKNAARISEETEAKLLDTVSNSSSEASIAESEDSEITKKKNGTESGTDNKDVDKKKKDLDKKKFLEIDIEQCNSKEKSHKKSKGLFAHLKKAKESKKKQDSDSEIKDTPQKDKDARKKSKDSTAESINSKQSDKELRKMSKDMNDGDKVEKKYKVLRIKSKDSNTGSKATKKKGRKSKKKYKDLNKSLSLKKNTKSKEHSIECEDLNVVKKKGKDGKKKLKGSDTELQNEEEKWDAFKSTGGSFSIKGLNSQQIVNLFGRPESGKAPLPEAQWIQKLI
ncbi:cylicin-1 [Monodelphis domestica]|uniref:Cylicin 1 n=1 Tax=Monodelphis domestica TaxID=13616 RepID=F6X0P6_MONDO|nr:cylicin-1 [Monodelphis domestica]XP_007507453.1 cylicin-1 [Monodelphis domestica]XP_007507454.1 cylicin-1 [Monodelphis domestica]XP_007507455.1 cylicin-1 [Monodelphis domestica]XP_007507456.1 cylicin-1 [Monodelphis domestica]XP_016282233.1 cylicin-1 [Monodelphis domestica]XP_056665856.1 cylicin-1 [Monodelphis domestica]